MKTVNDVLRPGYSEGLRGVPLTKNPHRLTTMSARKHWTWQRNWLEGRKARLRRATAT